MNAIHGENSRPETGSHLIYGTKFLKCLCAPPFVLTACRNLSNTISNVRTYSAGELAMAAR